MDESIIVYAITERGPDIIHTKSSLTPEKLQEISLYHLLLVAQGTWHHEGLFILPIPVDDLNKTCKAIFYGFTIKDPEQKDPRTNGTRYGCVIFFVSNTILGTLDIIEIQRKFDELFEKIKDYQQLKLSGTFTKIKTLISRITTIKKKGKSITKVKQEITSH